MKSRIVKKENGKLTIEIDMELEGSMLDQEELIQRALNEAGKLATREALKSFDTDGSPIVKDAEQMTSKGKKKKR